MMALLRPALEGAGDGSSDPRAGSEGGFRRRPHGVRAGSARIDRVGLAQARRRSAMSDDCWRLREATAELAAPYGGAQGGAAAAGASERGGMEVQDCGRQRGRAARRHAAPRCALRPSLPLVFSSRSVRRRRYLPRTRCGAQGTAVAAGASERGGRAVQDCGRQRGRAGRRHAAPRCALRPSLPLVFSSRSVQLWRPAEALCCCCVQFLSSDSSMLARSALEGLRGQAFGWLKRRSNGRDSLLLQRSLTQPNSRFSWHLLAEPLLL
jgi:hypothetical protein